VVSASAVVTGAQVKHARSYTTVNGDKRRYTEIVNGLRVRRAYTERNGEKRAPYTESVKKYGLFEELSSLLRIRRHTTTVYDRILPCTVVYGRRIFSFLIYPAVARFQSNLSSWETGENFRFV
jgi:hypothetical protein